MLGLERHHGVNPMHFLSYTHILPGLEDRVRSHAHDCAALKRLPASRCVPVEDTLAHQKVARGLGMRTVWMQRWLKQNSHGPEVGVYLHRKPGYVCARIRSLQHLHRELG